MYWILFRTYVLINVHVHLYSTVFVHSDDLTWLIDILCTYMCKLCMSAHLEQRLIRLIKKEFIVRL